MRILDLCCGAGGASVGYARAGWEVVGVDNKPQPNYPFEFHQADALTFPLGGFDAYHASFPCQAFTNAQKIRGNEHPDLITPGRQLLEQTGRPYVLENVPGSPLVDPIEFCGTMFSLTTYRHRLFELNGFEMLPPAHPEHVARTTKMGRPPRDGEFMHVVGNFSGVKQARIAMGIDWMTRDELREAIPPAYTEFIGRQMAASIS